MEQIKPGSLITLNSLEEYDKRTAGTGRATNFVDRIRSVEKGLSCKFVSGVLAADGKFGHSQMKFNQHGIEIRIKLTHINDEWINSNKNVIWFNKALQTPLDVVKQANIHVSGAYDRVIDHHEKHKLHLIEQARIRREAELISKKQPLLYSPELTIEKDYRETTIEKKPIHSIEKSKILKRNDTIEKAKSTIDKDYRESTIEKAQNDNYREITIEKSKPVPIITSEKFINVSCSIHVDDYNRLLKVATSQNLSVSAMVKQYLDSIIDGSISKIFIHNVNKTKLSGDKPGKPKLVGCTLKQSRIAKLDEILNKHNINRYQLIKSWVDQNTEESK